MHFSTTTTLAIFLATTASAATINRVRQAPTVSVTLFNAIESPYGANNPNIAVPIGGSYTVNPDPTAQFYSIGFTDPTSAITCSIQTVAGGQYIDITHAANATGVDFITQLPGGAVGVDAVGCFVAGPPTGGNGEHYGGP